MRLLLVVAGLLVLAVPAASGAATKTIRVTSVTISMRSHDVDPKGPSAGDTVIAKDHLVNAAVQFGKKKGAAVGTDTATVTLTETGAAIIKGRATLPGGTLTLSGVVKSLANGGIVVTVSGGTGAFAHMHGTLTVAPGSNHVLNVYRLTRASAPIA